MPERILKGGYRVIITEFEVRELDEFGDSQDVNHFESKVEAIIYARSLTEAKAVVVEKHVSKRPAHLFEEPDKFTILATFGNEQALQAGGWTISEAGAR